MTDGYVQPYQSLNSTAKVIRLPRKGEKSKSLGRGFWNRFLAYSTFSTPPDASDMEERRKSSSSLPTGRNSVTVTHNNSDSLSHVRKSRSNSKSSHTSLNTPIPSPRTSFISKGSVTKVTDSKNPEQIVHTPSGKTKTTVTVHLSKTSRNNSTPNLTDVENFRKSNRAVANSPKNRKASLSRSMINVQEPMTPSNFAEPFPIRNRSQSSESILGHRSNKDVELHSMQVFRQPKYRSRNKAERRIKQMEHLRMNQSCEELVSQLSKGVNRNVYENQNNLNLVDFINKEGFVTTSKTNLSASKRVPRVERKMSVPLQNGNPATIKNSPKLNSFSSQNGGVLVHKHPPKPNFISTPPRSVERTPVEPDHRWARRRPAEPIYAEINESEIAFLANRKTLVPTPTLKKKVTFSTFHEPINEGDPFTIDKKILPARFWGIVQVTLALRSKSDDVRRKVAHMCYQSILAGSGDPSSRFIGKVDNSRYGESVYLVLQKSCFDIRDSEGFVIAKHGFSDVSVVTQSQEDPNLFIYVGRCKFNGRIGVAVRFNKSKHMSLVLNAFKTSSL